MGNGFGSQSWIPFYTELADRLVAYRDNRSELIEKLKNAHQAQGIRFPKIENGEPVDIDPFTVFGLFNKGITNKTRISLLNGIKQEFEVGAAVPEAFDGIPLLNNLSATFYRFMGEREPGDIDRLWDMFACALDYDRDASNENRKKFEAVFDKVSSQRGVKWNLTMGLYWIRPYTYVNLDSRNRWFIDEREMLGTSCAQTLRGLKGKVPRGAQYLLMCDLFLEEMHKGAYAYTSFPELSCEAWTVSELVNEEAKARKQMENSTVAVLGDEGVETARYWLYSPGKHAEKWKDFFDHEIMALGWAEIGDIASYASKSEIAVALKNYFGGGSSYKNAAHALWQFANEMKPGDVVFVKKGLSTIVGRGVVSSDYAFDAESGEYGNIRSVNWTHEGSWPHPGQAAVKTLTDVTPYTEYVESLKSLFVEDETEEDEEQVEEVFPPYDKKDFLEEVYLAEESYDRLVSLVRNKKNVILQGAPGVGKTFMAKRLAYSMIGSKNANLVELIQFHQSYSYEDFIMGYRPDKDGFELKKGVFYNFCKRAKNDSDNDYFFIIDEINRGNLSKIFGELFMLIEQDKRGVELKLLYLDEKFTVPANVYIIGMMNTADRSLALLDYALRRRFAFFEVRPGFKTEGFRAYRSRLDDDGFNRVIQCVERLNDDIASDESLGRGFCIGHSYFCSLEGADEWRLREIVEYEIVPLLQEYWFDDCDKVESWADELRNAIR